MALRVTTLVIAVAVSTGSRHSGDVKRGFPCEEGFKRVRDEFRASLDFVESTEVGGKFLDDARLSFMPKSECSWSASKGLHAFIFQNLHGALLTAKEANE